MRVFDVSVCFFILCLFFGFLFEKVTVLKFLYRMKIREDIRKNAIKKVFFHLGLCLISLVVFMFSDYQRGLFGFREFIIACFCGYWMAYVYVLFLLKMKYKWLFLSPILLIMVYVSGFSVLFFIIGVVLVFSLLPLQQRLLKRVLYGFCLVMYQNYIKNNSL